jgi:hypothetical protein
LTVEELQKSSDQITSSKIQKCWDEIVQACQHMTTSLDEFRAKTEESEEKVSQQRVSIEQHGQRLSSCEKLERML